MTTTTRSDELFKEACDVLVGGVNSPVRAFNSVNSNPIFIKKAEGSKLYSEDGRAFIDYVLSFGPLLLGHAHPVVTKAITEAAKQGTSFGAPTENETKLARLIQKFYPSLEKIRFVNSGTEAAMSALRLARGYTNKKQIIKFDGCYHGHADSLLVAAGSGALTQGQPDSKGILDDTAKHTVVLPYNNAQLVQDYFSAHGKNVAAVIVEPVAGNMGVIPPEPGFLSTLRSVCDTYQSVLIFDEVMCGFRLPNGGAQQYFNIAPDLTILGKVIGGGLPCGAYGGKAEIMNYLSPMGPVYQAGTLSGNPLVMAAGIAMLNYINEHDTINVLCEKVKYLAKILDETLPFTVQYCGTLFNVFFTDQPLKDLDDVQKCDLDLFKKFHAYLLKNGIYTPPSQFEANFFSSAHSQEDINHTVKVIQNFQ